ncbi:hypothetical protein SAMN05421872_102214 [Nocardioides lianchengensis]|uniref:Uncharacterized protein n=1 Tax=Nocardioides lianchengensis TaxID=1045774 RepID=A0A1G6LDJ7_9ACTN|nr:hypothetical protein [Nocardioides lianchengensis]SDC41502.1 hypothetical protein SAMN05421872_102214 [Nocardioides lianchengensis]
MNETPWLIAAAILIATLAKSTPELRRTVDWWDARRRRRH